MATCLASELTPLAALRKPPRVVKISKVLARAAYSPRSCSSSRLLSTANKPSDGITAHHRALTLAHKTRALLPQALPSNGTETHLAGLPEFWDDVLRSAQSRSLSSQGPTAPARVVIHGVDQLSGTQDLITALLDSPLTSDASQHTSLNERWKNSADFRTLKIDYGTSVSDSGTFNIPSPWLRHNSVPLQVTEVSPSAPPELALKLLLEADIPIVVCNPLTQPLRFLFADTIPKALLANPNAIIVLTAGDDTPALRSYIDGLLAGSDRPTSQDEEHAPHRPRIVFVQPSRALRALDILRNNPTSPSMVQQYQDDFIGSGVPALSAAVSTIIASSTLSAHPSNTLAGLRLNAALSALRGSLEACLAALTTAQREIDRAHIGIDAVRGEIAEADAKMHRQVLGVIESNPRMTNGKQMANNRVGEALREAEAQVRLTMDRLVWWKLLYKVDEVAYIVTSAVESAWCKGLEKELILHTGRLSVLQTTFTSSATTLLRAFPSPSPFHSPVLENTLAQLRTNPSFPLAPGALTAPLYNRRAQLAHPTARLHAAAQRVVFTLGGGALAGGALSGAGWAGLLTSGPLAGIVGSGDMGTGTIIGLGLFGTLTGARWAVGRWERAKKRWWEDWTRVGEGLRRDLADNLDSTMRRQVALIPEKACSELEGMVLKRKQEIDEVRDEVETLQDELRSIEDTFRQ